jgi:hypothetical protein
MIYCTSQDMDAFHTSTTVDSNINYPKLYKLNHGWDIPSTILQCTIRYPDDRTDGHTKTIR